MKQNFAREKARIGKPLTLLTVILIASTALYGVADAQEATKGGTAVVAAGVEAAGVNPSISSNSGDLFSGCLIYEGLVKVNFASNEPEPGLAESWTLSEDGKTYTFKLRKAKWQDGADFTADDVVYSIPEVSAKFHPTFAAQVGQLIESVKAIDASTVEIKLKTPYGPFFLALDCANGGAIMPAHIFMGTDPRTNKASLTAPVGTGPFKLGEWVRGSSITFVRNDNYWDKGKPNLDSLVVSIVPNAAARVQSVFSGQADFVPGFEFPANDLETARRRNGIKVVRSGHSSSLKLMFYNTSKKPLDDARVRHALLKATDRRYIAEKVYPGVSTPGTKPWAEIPWSTAKDINYDQDDRFDVKAAAQALDAAGYKPDASGIRFTLDIYYDAKFPDRDQMGQALKSMWSQAGVAVNLRPMEAAVLFPRVHKEGNFDVYLTSYSAYYDPAIGIARAFVSNTIGRDFGNAARFSNPELDRLFDEGAKANTQADRGKLYAQAQAIIMKELPSVTVAESAIFDVSSVKLDGLWGSIGNGRWENAWIKN